MEQKKTRLKPLVYPTNKYVSGSQNTTQQMLLLKALQVTQDPKKLREMIGVRTVAEVYRTLDKLSMRKEYHEALTRSGISFDFIVDGIKSIAVTAEKDDTKLKALQTLLKSVGMDTYKETDGGSSGSWEEVLLKKIKDKESQDLLEAPGEYEVIQPKVPESVRKAEEEERQVLSSIYESKK